MDEATQDKAAAVEEAVQHEAAMVDETAEEVPREKDTAVVGGLETEKEETNKEVAGEKATPR